MVNLGAVGSFDLLVRLLQVARNQGPENRLLRCDLRKLARMAFHSKVHP